MRSPDGRGDVAADAVVAELRFAEEITHIEERSDDVNDQGMKALFLARREASDPMGFIVGAEIYDHLEKVVDRFEDVANRVSAILIENL